MTAQQHSIIEVAKRILDVSGIMEKQPNGFIKYYDDPWRGCFEISLAKRFNSREEILVITKLSENDEADLLMMVEFTEYEPIVQVFDNTTMWDVYLYACLADAENK